MILLIMQYKPEVSVCDAISLRVRVCVCIGKDWVRVCRKMKMSGTYLGKYGTVRYLNKIEVVQASTHPTKTQEQKKYKLEDNLDVSTS